MVVVGSQLSHADFRAALKGASSWITMLLRLVAFPCCLWASAWSWA